MERFVDSREVASMLGLSVRNARKILIAHGINPVNISAGRRRATYRWLESAVNAFLKKMHEDAQVKDRKAVKQQKPPKVRLSTMSNNDLFDYVQLTRNRIVQ